METLPATTKILANGAIYDTERKRIVSMRPDLAAKNTQITQVNAGEMQAQRMERKRAALAAGAQKALEAAGRVPSGDLDFVAAIGEALMISATDPSNRQQVRAADMLLRETGLGERQDAQPAVTGGQMSELVASLAQFAATIASITATSDQTSVVNGDIVQPGLLDE
jgi:hypothetical protein